MKYEDWQPCTGGMPGCPMFTNQKTCALCKREMGGPVLTEFGYPIFDRDRVVARAAQGRLDMVTSEPSPWELADERVKAGLAGLENECARLRAELAAASEQVGEYRHAHARAERRLAESVGWTDTGWRDRAYRLERELGEAREAISQMVAERNRMVNDLCSEERMEWKERALAAEALVNQRARLDVVGIPVKVTLDSPQDSDHWVDALGQMAARKLPRSAPGRREARPVASAATRADAYRRATQESWWTDAVPGRAQPGATVTAVSGKFPPEIKEKLDDAMGRIRAASGQRSAEPRQRQESAIGHVKGIPPRRREVRVVCDSGEGD